MAPVDCLYGEPQLIDEYHHLWAEAESTSQAVIRHALSGHQANKLACVGRVMLVNKPLLGVKGRPAALLEAKIASDQSEWRVR